MTARAVRDIRNALAFLAVEAPHHADDWLSDLQRVVVALGTFPRAHPIAPEAHRLDAEVRHVVMGRTGRWRVFFTVDGTTVQVLHIRHTSRAPWQP
nr:type II toxin-antitoxin system RelE/ParE family toxin [Roseospira goensis]